MINNSKAENSNMFINEEKSNKYGNMKFFCGAYCVLNSKMIGLFFTTLIHFSSSALVIYLMLENFKESYELYTIVSVFCLSALIISFLIYFVSFSNPGYFKPLHTDIEYEYIANNPLAKIKDSNLFLKYCKTCKIVKDLRVFHCKICDLCVLRHDHHCPWLSVCIGANNHLRFLFLIMSSIMHCLILIGMMSLMLIEYDRNEGFFSKLIDLNLNDDRNKYNYYIALGLSSLTTVVILLLLLIIFFQTRFILSNETTSENIRRPAHLMNVFDNGCKKNIKEFCGNITGYTNEVVYNQNALNFLGNLMLLTKHYLLMKTRGSVTNINNLASVKTQFSTSSEIEMNISNYSNNTLNNLIVENINTK